jgi:hypothetical protein
MGNGEQPPPEVVGVALETSDRRRNIDPDLRCDILGSDSPTAPEVAEHGDVMSPPQLRQRVAVALASPIKHRRAHSHKSSIGSPSPELEPILPSCDEEAALGDDPPASEPSREEGIVVTQRTGDLRERTGEGCGFVGVEVIEDDASDVLHVERRDLLEALPSRWGEVRMLAAAIVGVG